MWRGGWPGRVWVIKNDLLPRSGTTARSPKSSRPCGRLRDPIRGLPHLVSARAGSGSARPGHGSRGGAVRSRSYGRRSRPDVCCRLGHRNPEGHVRDKADDDYRYAPDRRYRRLATVTGGTTENAVGGDIGNQRQRACPAKRRAWRTGISEAGRIRPNLENSANGMREFADPGSQSADQNQVR